MLWHIMLVMGEGDGVGSRYCDEDAEDVRDDFTGIN